MSTKTFGSRSFLKGAVLLTAAGLIGKVLSALYRIPYQNMAGDVGYYVYQQIYPFIGAVMVVSLYGFPVAISKIVIENEKKQGLTGAKMAVISSLIWLCMIFVPLFLFFYWQAPLMAQWMGDPALIQPLRAISPIYLFVPFISTFRGYQQGKGRMEATAISHLLEQCVRVSMILLLAWFILQKSGDVYQVGTGAAVGSILGATVALFSLSLFMGKRFWMDWQGVSWQWLKKQLLLNMKPVFVQGALICTGSMLFIFYQLIDALTIVNLLVEGVSSMNDPRVEKGIFDRGQPLLQFGTVIATSMALAIVPKITTDIQNHHIATARQHGTLAMKVSVCIGVAAAIGLFLIARPINIMLFTNDEGTTVLKILSISLGISGFVMTSQAILQGHGHTARPIVHLLFGLILKTGLHVIWIPSYGIEGAAWATVLGLLVTAVLNAQWMYRVQFVDIPHKKDFTAPLIALLTMIMTVWVILVLTSSFMEEGRMAATVQAILATLTGGSIFLYTLMKTAPFSVKHVFKKGRQRERPSHG